MNAGSVISRVKVKLAINKETAINGALKVVTHLCLIPRIKAISDAPAKATKDRSLGALNGSYARPGAMNKVVIAREVREINAKDF
jgi:hypothetical protein